MAKNTLAQQVFSCLLVQEERSKKIWRPEIAIWGLKILVQSPVGANIKKLISDPATWTHSSRWRMRDTMMVKCFEQQDNKITSASTWPLTLVKCTNNFATMPSSEFGAFFVTSLLMIGFTMNRVDCSSTSLWLRSCLKEIIQESHTLMV